MRDFSNMNSYKPQVVGREQFCYVGVKSFEEKVSKKGNEMIEIVFDNDIKQLLVIDPTTEKFYGFSDSFLADLTEGFGQGKQGLGDVLNELANKSSRKAWVKAYKEYYARDDGTSGYQFKVFKILKEKPNEEQINHYNELGDKASEASRKKIEGSEPKPEMRIKANDNEDGDDEFPFD